MMTTLYCSRGCGAEGEVGKAVTKPLCFDNKDHNMLPISRPEAPRDIDDTQTSTAEAVESVGLPLKARACPVCVTSTTCRFGCLVLFVLAIIVCVVPSVLVPTGSLRTPTKSSTKSSSAWRVSLTLQGLSESSFDSNVEVTFIDTASNCLGVARDSIQIVSTGNVSSSVKSTLRTQDPLFGIRFDVKLTQGLMLSDDIFEKLRSDFVTRFRSALTARAPYLGEAVIRGITLFQLDITELSSQPTSVPTSGTPSYRPSSSPTSAMPSIIPSAGPSRPSANPSEKPTTSPSTEVPSGTPTDQPSESPTHEPSSKPSETPTSIPTLQPSREPTSKPSEIPTSIPTLQPSRQPTSKPSEIPTTIPTLQPSRKPTSKPSAHASWVCQNEVDLVQAYCSSAKCIPGLSNFIGRGYDITKMSAFGQTKGESAFAAGVLPSRVYDFPAANYPIDIGGITFRGPSSDELTVDTAINSVTNQGSSEYYDSFSTFSSTIDKIADLQATLGAALLSVAATTVKEAEFALALLNAAGSQSSTADAIKSSVQSSSYLFTAETFYNAVRLTVAANSHGRSCATKFSDDLRQLPSVYHSSTRRAFQSFFTTYGTHVVVGALLGGSLSVSTSVASCKITNPKDLKQNSQSFGDQVLQYMGTVLGVKSITLPSSYEQTLTKNSIVVCGGNAARYVAENGGFGAWTSTILDGINSGVAINKVYLIPIFETVSGDLKTNLALAMFDYLNDIPKASNATTAFDVCRTSSARSEETCFAATEMLTMESGESRMISSARVGDRVLSYSKHSGFHFAEVIAVPHPPNNLTALFCTLAMSSGRSLTLTEDHLIVAGGCNDEHLSLTPVHRIRIGFCISTVSGRDELIAKSFTLGTGVYTIVTAADYIVVNGVVSSPFALNHPIPFAYYSIYRWVHRLFLGNSHIQHLSDLLLSVTGTF